MHDSKTLFERAKKVIPGGVNSPARAFKAVGGTPLFMQRGVGPFMIDVEGKRYVDYIGSWGPLILGHADARVLAALHDAMQRGTSFGAPTLLEIEMAEKVMQCMGHIEKIRMVNSGTEATMSAIRLARGYTGKAKIIKFEGCYHGHNDGLLVEAGAPSSLGVLLDVAAQTLVARYNDRDQLTDLFRRHRGDIAGVIVEPIAGNMGMVLPADGFLQGLRRLCDDEQAVLIFDEVMTGFRVALGGAQALYAVEPDLTTLGKVIGGGLPVGAVGGRAEIMDWLAPEGGVYQAGTLSGNPMAMTAGLTTLSIVQAPNFYRDLNQQAQALVQGLTQVAARYGVPFSAHALGGMFGFFFASRTPQNYHDVLQSDLALFKQFFHAMLLEGVYFAPSPFEAGFISASHTDETLAHTLTAADRVLRTLA